MRSLLLSMVFLLSATAALPGQNVDIKEDPAITAMMNRFVEINKSRTYVEAWRVQILATTDRQRLENVRQTFQYRYPNIKPDWVHDNPFYKLRAGAFATKLEAERLKHILEQDYPGAYPVKDNMVKPEELVSNY